MSEWTHSICERCWRRHEGGSVPARMKDPYAQLETCCFCLQKHQSGIYVRYEPTAKVLKCGGEHEDEMNVG